MIIAWVFSFLNFPIMGDFIKIECQEINVQWIHAASLLLY